MGFVNGYRFVSMGSPEWAEGINNVGGVGLPYTEKPVNIWKKEQFSSDFLAISPNNQISAIVDHDGSGCKLVSVFESRAILLYLGEKEGKLTPTDPRKRIMCLEWLMWQMGGVGPMFGQAHHFLDGTKEEVPFAIERYVNECHRLYGVLNDHLESKEYVAGSEYSVADLAIIPWVQKHARHRTKLEDFICVERWCKKLTQRPAIKRGMARLGENKFVKKFGRCRSKNIHFCIINGSCYVIQRFWAFN